MKCEKSKNSLSHIAVQVYMARGPFPAQKGKPTAPSGVLPKSEFICQNGGVFRHVIGRRAHVTCATTSTKRCVCLCAVLTVDSSGHGSIGRQHQADTERRVF